MKITINIDVTEINKAVEKLTALHRNTAPLMSALSQDMLSAVEDNFEAEGRPKWAAWSASYAATREGGKMLQRTGRLAASITAYHSASEAGVGTNVIYARIHHLGGQTKPHVIRPKHGKALKFGAKFAAKVQHPGSKIPARPFLSMTEEDRQGMQETVLHYLQNALTGR